MPSPRDHDTVEGYDREVLARSAASPVNGAIFYSGWSQAAGESNRARAMAHAAAQPAGRAACVEHTPLGAYLDSQHLRPESDRTSPFSNADADRIWADASARYAGEASGRVTCFVDGARPNGVFRSREWPVLLGNQQVSHLNDLPREDLAQEYGRDPDRAFGQLDESSRRLPSSRDLHLPDTHESSANRPQPAPDRSGAEAPGASVHRESASPPPTRALSREAAGRPPPPRDQDDHGRFR